MTRGVNKVFWWVTVAKTQRCAICPLRRGYQPQYRNVWSWKDKNTGDQQERTEWHRVVFFNRLAEIVEQYVKKGTKLYVEGSLRTRKWQGQDGQDRYTTEIVASEMQMLDSRVVRVGMISSLVRPWRHRPRNNRHLSSQPNQTSQLSHLDRHKTQTGM